MQVLKRDGRAVDFDKSKIVTAIQKANTEVRKKERATKEDIDSIIEYIIAQNKQNFYITVNIFYFLFNKTIVLVAFSHFVFNKSNVIFI